MTQSDTTFRKRGFTLLEMLAVMAMIVLVLSISLPAFKKVGDWSAVSAGSREVSTVMFQARQHAITHRTTVRFVYPGASNVTETAYVEKRNKAYNVIAYNKQDQKWEYLDKWRYLPKGVIFSHSNDNQPDEAELLFPDNTSSLEKQLKYIEFSPMGTCGNLISGFRDYVIHIKRDKGTENVKDVIRCKGIPGQIIIE